MTDKKIFKLAGSIIIAASIIIAVLSLASCNKDTDILIDIVYVCECAEVDTCPDDEEDKVALCHLTGNGSHTIWVSPNAVDAHVNHGDTEGECND